MIKHAIFVNFRGDLGATMAFIENLLSAHFVTKRDHLEIH